jgi:hypothetical protein
MNSPITPSSTARVLKSVLSLLNLDVTDFPLLLWKAFRPLFSQFTPPGIYEVLEHEATLELCDPQGREVVYRKRQKVRFLQDNIIAYQDKAWGDGDIFAEYRCSPGLAVDRYREGHYYRILISLRQTKQRGDIEEFQIERKIINGFTRHIEDLQTEIDHRTHYLTVHIIFPPDRVPMLLTWIEQKRSQTTAIGVQHLQKLPDGRRQVTWSTNTPRLFESYLLRWEW